VVRQVGGAKWRQDLANILRQAHELRREIESRSIQWREGLAYVYLDRCTALLNKVVPLEAEFIGKMALRDENGYTLMQRALVYRERRFREFLLRFSDEVQPMGQRILTSTLKNELQWAVSRGDGPAVDQLLRLGASVSSAPGKYSVLGLANIFGEPRIARMVADAGAQFHVPWEDPENRRDSRWKRLQMLRNQFERVRQFFKSTNRDHQSGQLYDEQILEYLRCRIDNIARFVSTKPGGM